MRGETMRVLPAIIIDLKKKMGAGLHGLLHKTCSLMIRNSGIFLSFLFLASCSFSGKTEKQSSFEPGMVLSYDKALPLSQKYSDLFSRVETIPLDTTGNFLVSDIRQFRYALDHFFVLSRDEILIFDRQGKGIARINRYGQGREEYLSLLGFDVCEKDSTVCLLTYPSKLMHFSLDGRLLREHKIGVRGFEIALLPDHSWSIFTNNLRQPESDTITLLDIYDETNGTSRHLIDGYTNLGNQLLPSFQQNRVFTHSRNGREVLFAHPLSNHIWSITSQDSVRIKYTLDFGEKNPPEDAPEMIHPDESPADAVMKYWPVYGFNSCWENNRYLYIQAFVDKQLKDILFDKQSRQLYAGWMTDDLIYCQIRPVEATDELLVGYITADDLISLEDYLNSRPEEKQPEQVTRLIERAQEEGNPIVCLYHLK